MLRILLYVISMFTRDINKHLKFLSIKNHRFLKSELPTAAKQALSLLIAIQLVKLL